MGEREKVLIGRWVHSSEEDTEDSHVFRPSTYSLPPARGRAQMAFTRDHTVQFAGIGPTDISRVAQGTWTGDVEGGEALDLNFGGDESPQRAELTEDDDGPVLRLRKTR